MSKNKDGVVFLANSAYIEKYRKDILKGLQVVIEKGHESKEDANSLFEKIVRHQERMDAGVFLCFAGAELCFTGFVVLELLEDSEGLLWLSWIPNLSPTMKRKLFEAVGQYIKENNVKVVRSYTRRNPKAYQKVFEFMNLKHTGTLYEFTWEGRPQ